MPNSPLPKAAERVELIVAGEIYQVAHTAKAEVYVEDNQFGPRLDR
jgi:hypothetical protein